jgi:glycosidase
MMQSMWYKNAIVYALDVETFMDSNGDGVGDFPGLTQRLDYLSGLGVTCLWLHPFYPSPQRDDGYDVMDYYNVDPCLGTLGDFVDFMHVAKEQGIRVLVDLVVNHTSIQHPWFQAARSDKHSKYRDYYVWSDNSSPTDPAELVFPDTEDSIWEYDEQAGAYYLHHFYKEQPDLNISNPAVRDEIRKIMHFWLALGVSGFRMDTVPYLFKNVEALAEQYELESFLADLRDYVSSRNADAVLLAEANVESKSFSTYFGEGDRIHMLFSFFANQKKFLALARQDATPLIDGLIAEGEYSYKQVNVAAQQRESDSLLNWFDRAIRIRKQCPEFGCGNWKIIETSEICVFAHCCEIDQRAVLAVHNLSNQPCTATLKIDLDRSLIELFSDHPYEPLSSPSISLEPFGYRWFRVEQLPHPVQG